jgi:hypothetical protein
VEILHPLRLRYFSSGELLRLFCFEDVGSNSSFRWTDGLSMKTKYRLIGNSVNVLVVTTLIECLCQNGYVCGRVTECAGRGKDHERARFSPSSTYHHHRLLFTIVSCCLSPTISSIFSVTLKLIFCASRGFMLRPFSDSRQVLRVIHPNIAYSVCALSCSPLPPSPLSLRNCRRGSDGCCLRPANTSFFELCSFPVLTRFFQR